MYEAKNPPELTEDEMEREPVQERWLMGKLRIEKAVRTARKLRLALQGPAGSGKTFTALMAATALSDKVLVMDTEHGSSSLYTPELGQWDVVNVDDDYSPDVYIDVVNMAQRGGYGVLLIDSLSHGWGGKGGALELADKFAAKYRGNSFAGWKDVTPMQHRMIDSIMGANLHVIATMRTKTGYVMETGRNGKQAPRKVGLAPVQRDGVDYEFDVVGEMDVSHSLVITKARTKVLQDSVYNPPKADTFVAELVKWVAGNTDGLPEPAPKPEAKEATFHAVEDLEDAAEPQRKARPTGYNYPPDDPYGDFAGGGPEPGPLGILKQTAEQGILGRVPHTLIPKLKKCFERLRGLGYGDERIVEWWEPILSDDYNSEEDRNDEIVAACNRVKTGWEATHPESDDSSETEINC
ncbi:MAG: AAA family ATPase [Chloroflexi bacterium]|nr:AAA family ATPase [Chloroflexota bacterium]